MSYIAPNSTIDIFVSGSVPLTRGNENYFYFSSESARDNHFESCTKVRLSNQYYVHKDRGHVRVQATPTQLLGASYLRYKNISFENHWIYAYVTHVEYVSNVVQDVFFEIDSVTTWLPFATLKQCFIERQHSETDEIGDNIVDEGLPIGDYVVEASQMSEAIHTVGWCYCVATTFDPDDPEADPEDITPGQTWNGMYSGLIYTYVGSDSALNDIITTATKKGKSDGIIGIARVPLAFSQSTTQTTPLGQQATVSKPLTGFPSRTNVSQLYVPQNNKLFIYPYKELIVDNTEGNVAEFRYEFFNSTNCVFQIFGTSGLETELICYPKNYKGVVDNLYEKISMTDFPLCSWKTDLYQAYLAQNKSTRDWSAKTDMMSIVAGVGVMALSTPGMLFGGAGSAGFSQGASGVVSGVTNMIQRQAKENDMARKPQQLSGKGSANTLCAMGTNGAVQKEFYFRKLSIDSATAMRLDKYFTMYGYKQNTVGTPNIHARSRFTYVQTNGCQITGAIPSDDKAFIESRFDAGVRFWADTTTFCNYSTANSVLST